MRIISGTARGRRLVAPKGEATRPILDIQKESLFNILRDHLPCGGVLDVFAGSGALGLEALSRGAERATFVERAARALEALTGNLRSCGFEDRARVLARDAFTLEPERIDHPLGLVFLDPPFPLYLERPEKVHALAAAIAARGPLEDGAALMLRVPRQAAVPPWPEPLEAWDRRTAGESVMILLRKRPAEAR